MPRYSVFATLAAHMVDLRRPDPDLLERVMHRGKLNEGEIRCCTVLSIMHDDRSCWGPDGFIPSLREMADAVLERELREDG